MNLSVGSTSIKVGILGAGAMGGTVIEHLQECPQVRAIVAQDIRDERVAELKQKYGIHATTQLEDILADPDVALVFITSANHAHKELTLAALRAGKAVMCEKPMANTLADAVAMVQCAEQTGGFLQIGFELRYSSLYTQVKKWIDAGLLGKVINTQCKYICSEFVGRDSWRVKHATGGSMFGEKLSHYVDLPRWWVGSPVLDVFSVCAPNVVPYYEIRDNYQCLYRFANGAASSLNFIMYVGQTFEGDPLRNVVDQQQGDGHELKYLVVGDQGAAETDVFSRTIKRWQFGDAPKGMTSRLVETLTWTDAEDHVYFHNTHDQTHDIVRRVIAGQPPMTPARDALETTKLCFAAEESADTGQVVRLDSF
ncbi:MAG: Gfo/Idh/MocA family oxidoreductase [Phycisphaeraceae bacterium]|nr:Gfo/Idh/MocA family oxidoreductase [Phycisphaeraceae bacterium]